MGHDLNPHLCGSKPVSSCCPVLPLGPPLLPRVKQLTRAEKVKLQLRPSDPKSCNVSPAVDSIGQTGGR